MASGGAPAKEQVEDQVKEEGESGSESKLNMSEDQLIEALGKLGKYRIIPVNEEEEPPVPRAESTPKRSLRFVGTSQSYPPDDPSHNVTNVYSNPHHIPKVPQFSGEEPPLKGDVSYAEWRFEIRCLGEDPEISNSTLVQAMRRSLRGIARRMLIPLGDKATSREILYKLDSLFGDISTHGMLMQEFFNSSQKPNESATAFGCRLESLLQPALENGSLHKSSKNDLMRHKFWTSLSSDKLKSQTRHKYDTLTGYSELLREIRVVEKELSLTFSTGTATGASQTKKGHQHVVNAESEQQVAAVGDIEKKFDQKLKSLEEKLSSQIEGKFDKILDKLGNRSSGNSQRSGQDSQRSGQNNKGRGRGGYNRSRGNWHNNKDKAKDVRNSPNE
ncbi:uncharacterized protein LOC110442076 [Mizuhopecten yessoensis]|uniref:uncharacterized protein LOC110442076 n=1 Tax=Mizuhopecten yessoensis TaxID=6573 RepID=UPI000B45C9C4|nr:uncharacterized protein LOC110442076 [Mizuhopecten yessoensis]